MKSSNILLAKKFIILEAPLPKEYLNLQNNISSFNFEKDLSKHINGLLIFAKEERNLSDHTITAYKSDLGKFFINTLVYERILYAFLKLVISVLT